MARPRRTATASACALLGLALLCAAPRVPAQTAAQPAPLAAEQPAVPVPQPVEPLPDILPADLGPPRPVPTPPSLRPGRPDAREGLQFGLGLPYVELRSRRLDLRMHGGKLSQTGVLVHVEAVSDPFRLGYARQIYRRELPPDTTLDGAPVDRISLDSDQLWAWHGLRAAQNVFLGYGLGWQSHQVRLFSGDAQVRELAESSFLAGLMADWALGLPFSVQLRLYRDLGTHFVEMRAGTLQLAFIAAF